MSSIKQIAWGPGELVNQYNDTGSGHFFDKDTMRFFRSRLTSHYVRFNDDMAAFITTEQPPHGPRKATIRTARVIEYIREPDGRVCQKISISTLGEFCEMSLAQAKGKLEKLIVKDAFPNG